VITRLDARLRLIAALLLAVLASSLGPARLLCRAGHWRTEDVAELTLTVLLLLLARPLGPALAI